MRRFAVRALLSALLPLSLVTPSVAEEAADASAPTNVRAATESTSHRLGADGAFTYSVPIAVPEFRGLVPNLALAYNSQNQSRRGAEAYLGLGWRLAGMSSIELRSERGGAPTYEPEHDIYVMDGEELLACDDADAANKWAWDYPTDFKTTGASASCASGGNMVSLRDNYLKIERVGGPFHSLQAKFYVYHQNGTRLTYENLGTVANITENLDEGGRRAAFRRKWVLTKIEDTQARPNVVSIDYHIDNKSNGYTPRPKTISYAGYKVSFYYDTSSSQPVTGFATGTSIIAKQRHRLRSITVTEGSSTKIRGYRFDYNNSSQTDGNLLSKVRQFGRNYTLSNGLITKGGELPSWNFAYHADSTYFGTQQYSGEFHTSLAVSDQDQNGKDDLLFYKYVHKNNGTTTFKLNTNMFTFNADRSLASTSNPNLPNPSATYTGNDRTFISPLGLTRRDRTTGQKYVVMRIQDGTTSDLNNQTLKSYQVGSKTVLTTVVANSACVHKTEPVQAVIGNFDKDPESEVVFGNQVYNVDDGKLRLEASRRGALATELCAGKDFPDNGFASADIDGDGQDELIGKSAYLDIRNEVFERIALSNSPFANDNSLWIVRFGDVNGDGMADAVIHDRAGTDRVGVSLSRGNGFAAIDWSWDDHMGLVDLWEQNFGSPRNMVVDINGDGLADLITHNGYDGSSVAPNSNAPLDPMEAHIYLSTGDGFVRQSQSAWRKIPSFLGAGDFNGDGQMDMVFLNDYQNDAPTIAYSGSVVPNLMRQVTDPKGGVTDIEYSPSTAFADNEIPGVQQLVTTVTKSNGFNGQTRVTSFAYEGARYDSRHRKSLGFGKVTTFLPKANGEVEPAQLVTLYENANWGLKGRIWKQTLSYQGDVQRETVNTWDHTGTAARPLRAQKASTVSRERWGTELVGRTKFYTFNEFNQPVSVTDKGFGGKKSSRDDVTTVYDYKTNRADYVVNKLSWTAVGTGSSVSYSDRSNWLRAQYFSYDGSPDFFVKPTRGNLTKVETWSGADNQNRRMEQEFGYDDWGNVVWTDNARNKRTTFAYDAAKHLFLTQTTNVLGHTASTDWDTRCGVASTTTDANGLQSQYYYDVFCRETRTVLPNGRNIRTAFIDLGDPTKQYVRVRSDSASLVSGRKTIEEREYFNGFGQAYKNTRSGTTDNINDAVATLTGYDGRGNLAWVSNPLAWADSNIVYPSDGERTFFLNDSLGRVVRQNNADGTYTTTEYTTAHFSHRTGQRLEWPTEIYRDEHCTDATSANTICGLSQRSFDAQANVIRTVLYDDAFTDVGTGSVAARYTNYYYDHLGQLASVVDPIGASWSYSYDVYGNRITSNDPALGTWQSEFDVMGNITRQVDAANQEITFEYDNLERVKLKRVGTGTSRTDTRYYYDEPRAGYYNLGQLTGQRVWTPQDGYYHSIYSDYGAEGQVRKKVDELDGLRYEQYFNYRKDGSLHAARLPYLPGTQKLKWLAPFEYDAAGRMTSFGSYITNVSYNIWDNPTQIDYGNGTRDTLTYDADRGWLNRKNTYLASGSRNDYIQYLRSATGRIKEHRTHHKHGWLKYTYDYAGRLLTVTNTKGKTGFNQQFTYDRAGSMRSNSHLGSYIYASQKHTPHRIVFDQDGVSRNFTHDANGNMTTIPAFVGSNYRPKDLTYDQENRVTAVAFDGKTTEYIYGADGSRLKTITNVGTANESVTTTFGMVEIQNYGEGANEVLTYPHGSVRLQNDVPSIMHKDLQNTVRMITNQAGERAKYSVYEPFGQQTNWSYDPTMSSEDNGWIGEKFDADAGLQYLNARYYDPDIGLFTQPDWWEVTTPGVGTNRYSYSFNDPVNLMDPNGNATVWSDEDGDGLNETATHFPPDSEIGRDLDSGNHDSYYDYKNNWGELRNRFGDVTGSQYATWNGSGFDGLDRSGQVSVSVTRNSPERWVIAGTFAAADGPFPVGDIVAGGIIAYTLWEGYKYTSPAMEGIRSASPMPYRVRVQVQGSLVDKHLPLNMQGIGISRNRPITVAEAQGSLTTLAGRLPLSLQRVGVSAFTKASQFIGRAPLHGGLGVGGSRSFLSTRVPDPGQFRVDVEVQSGINFIK